MRIILLYKNNNTDINKRNCYLQIEIHETYRTYFFFASQYLSTPLSNRFFKKKVILVFHEFSIYFPHTKSIFHTIKKKEK